MKLLSKITLALAVLAPAKIFACAACYASNADINDPMVEGVNWSIAALGVVVVTVLATFLTYFIFIMRKSAMLEAAAQQKSPEKLCGSQGDKTQTGKNVELPFASSPEPAKV